MAKNISPLGRFCTPHSATYLCMYALRSCRYVRNCRKRKEQYNFVSQWCRNFQQKGAFHFLLVFSFAFHPWIEFPLPPLQTHYATAVCISFRFLCILYLRRRRSWNGFIAFTEKNDNYRMKHTRVLKTCHIWTRSSDIDSVDIILIMLLSVLSTLFTHWLGINIALISKRSKTNHDVVI